MTKRKSFRLSEQSRNSLKAELSKYKSGPPLGKIAKTYGVSLSTVNYHWATIQHARKAGRKLDKDLAGQMERSLAENTEQEALRAIGIMDAVDKVPPTRYVATAWSEDETKPAKPNGHITVNIDPDWLEDVTRTEVMNLVREALRK